MNVQLISLYFLAFVQKPKYMSYLHVLKIPVKSLQQTISHFAVSVIVFTDFPTVGEFLRKFYTFVNPILSRVWFYFVFFYNAACHGIDRLLRATTLFTIKSANCLGQI